MSRTGKIARLPQPLREELNHRLENGEPGKNLADWLNTLPEVTALLATHFENRPISEQNVSDWRHGGFVAWQLHRDLLYGAGACAEDSAAYAACGVSAKHFLAILNAHFASSLQAWDGGPGGQPIQNLRMLKYLYATVLSLRRSEQHDERLALDRDRLEFTREKQSPRPPRKSKSPSSTSSPASTETPPAASPATPPIQPPPNPLHQPPSIIPPTRKPHPIAPAQTTTENSLEAAPSIPSIPSISSISSTVSAPAKSHPRPPRTPHRNLAPSPKLSKPAKPAAQPSAFQPPAPQPSTPQQPAPKQSAPAISRPTSSPPSPANSRRTRRL